MSKNNKYKWEAYKPSIYKCGIVFVLSSIPFWFSTTGICKAISILFFVTSCALICYHSYLMKLEQDKEIAEDERKLQEKFALQREIVAKLREMKERNS